MRKMLTIGVKAFRCTMCGDAIYGRSKYEKDDVSCYCGNLTTWGGCYYSHHQRIFGSDRFNFEVKFPQTARMYNVYLKLKPASTSNIIEMFRKDLESERNKYGKWTDPEFNQELRIASKAKMDLIKKNEN